MALLAVPAFAIAQSDDKAKEAKRAEMLAECQAMVKEQATSEAAAAAFTDFCTCQTDNILKNLTMDEIAQLEKLESADEATKQKMTAKVQPLLMPCFEELQKKMGGGQ